MARRYKSFWRIYGGMIVGTVFCVFLAIVTFFFASFAVEKAIIPTFEGIVDRVDHVIGYEK